MLNTLLSAFPETGLNLYRTLDYWECRELLDIIGIGKTNPPDRLQNHKNDVFNSFLDSIAYKKLNWQFLSEQYNLFQIKEQTESINSNSEM